jgi:hypothetical protein
MSIKQPQPTWFWVIDVILYALVGVLFIWGTYGLYNLGYNYWMCILLFPWYSCYGLIKMYHDCRKEKPKRM